MSLENTESTIQSLWDAEDFEALHALLRRELCFSQSQQTLVWLALCFQAMGDHHAAYRSLAPLLGGKAVSPGVYALVGGLGEKLELPEMALHGWQSALNADPLDATYLRRLTRTYIAQDNAVMAVALLKKNRPYQMMDVASDDAPASEALEVRQPASVSNLLPIEREATLVIVPVYEDYQVTMRCIGSLLKSLDAIQSPVWVLVVNDCSPNEEINAWLRDLSHPRLEVIENLTNRGFVGAANIGLSRYPENDAILLNSDTIVSGNWVDRLRDVAYQDEDIASVTPLSNFGELVSFPKPMASNPMHGQEYVELLDSCAARAGATMEALTIPVGVGFCWYLKRSALDAVGILNEKDYRRGYGEEVDLCLRFAAAGYRNVCAPNVYVGHEGSRSFGAEKAIRVAQNNAVLKKRYPDYDKKYSSFVRQDHLARVRCRLELEWLHRSGHSWNVVVINDVDITSDYILTRRAQALRTARHLLIVSQNQRAASLVYKIRTESDLNVSSLQFSLPNQVEDFRALMDGLAIQTIESSIPVPDVLEGVLGAVQFTPVTEIEQEGLCAGLLAKAAVEENDLSAMFIEEDSTGTRGTSSRVIAIQMGENTSDEFDQVFQVGRYLAQQQLPIRLWLQQHSMNDVALLRLGCVDIGLCPERLAPSIHLKAGGATNVWRPLKGGTLDVVDLVNGW